MKKNYGYELWAMGFTEDEESTDYDELLAEFPHTKKGKEEAIELLREVKAETLRLSDYPEVKLIELAVEEVADFSDTERSAVDIVATRWIERD